MGLDGGSLAILLLMQMCAEGFLASNSLGVAGQMEIAAPHTELMYFKVRLGAACQLQATCAERVGEPRGLPFVM